MIKTTVCPSSWNARRTSSTTRCPTCRSGAVGSSPSLTLSLSPRLRRACRCSVMWIWTARSRRRSKNAELTAALGMDWAGTEVQLRIGGERGREDGDEWFLDLLGDRHDDVRPVVGIADPLLRRSQL